MNIILFTKYIGSPMTLRMGHSHFYFFALAVILAVCFLLFVAGFYLGTQVNEGDSIFPGSDRIASKEQRAKKVEDLRQEYQNYINAILFRVAELQARVDRLDELGRRVAKRTSLSKEYDFTQPPQGGHYKEIAHNGNIETLLKSIKELTFHVRDREPKLSSMDTLLMYRSVQKQLLPVGRPVAKGRSWVSSRYGYRRDPKNRRRAWHDGMDFAAPKGTPIRASGAGVVTSSSYRYGYGNLVEINHGDHSTRYAHNHKNLVVVGQKVRKNQKIALVGTTGRSTGYHLHYEVRKQGKTTNPLPYVNGTLTPEMLASKAAGRPPRNKKKKQLPAKKIPRKATKPAAPRKLDLSPPSAPVAPTPTP